MIRMDEVVLSTTKHPVYSLESNACIPQFPFLSSDAHIHISYIWNRLRQAAKLSTWPPCVFIIISPLIADFALPFARFAHAGFCVHFIYARGYSFATSSAFMIRD
jgi:hypothetical protein